MDVSVITGIPKKVVIFDPREQVTALTSVLLSLDCVLESELNDQAVEGIARLTLIAVMEATIMRRRAWAHGNDVELEMTVADLRGLVGHGSDYMVTTDVKEVRLLRDEIRTELEEYESRMSETILNELLKSISRSISSRMNSNLFVVHKLAQIVNSNTIMLEEYDDWRVIEWTKAEQAKIDARHETI